MEEKIKLFKAFWQHNYAYISLELDDDEIAAFVNESRTIAQAADRAADYLLAQGLTEVEE